jgi:hypothetical protein
MYSILLMILNIQTVPWVFDRLAKMRVGHIINDNAGLFLIPVQFS